MERSESIDKLAAALSKFQGALEQPSLNSNVQVRTKTGGTYTFKYADFAECKRAAQKPLADNELAVTQMIEDDYAVLTMLLHSSGQWIASRVKIPATEAGAQAIGSATTYAKRYSFCAILGLVADDDDDGNISQGNSVRKETVKPKFSQAILENPQFFAKIKAKEDAAIAGKQQFSVADFLQSVYTISKTDCDMAVEKYRAFRVNN